MLSVALLSSWPALASDALQASGEIALFVVLVALVFVPLEWAFPTELRPAIPPTTGWRTDLAFALLGGALVRVLLVPITIGLLWVGDRVGLEAAPWHAVSSPAVSVALDLGVGLVLFELASYAYHRAAHSVPALWRLHAVHHSSERLDWLASFRQHPVEIVLLTLTQNLPLVLLSVPLASHIVLLVGLRLHTVFVHSELGVAEGPWARIVAMPAFHRRHHARELPATNFASLFPWIDVCFGTHDDGFAWEFGTPDPMPGGFLALLRWPMTGEADIRPITADQSQLAPFLVQSPKLQRQRVVEPSGCEDSHPSVMHLPKLQRVRDVDPSG